jgi:L-fuconolactonase
MIDGHQHFWDPGRFDYPWMTRELDAIRRPFGPRDLQPDLEARGVSQTIVVQALASPEETIYLLDIAASTSFVAGVVGWMDLTEPSLENTIARLRRVRGGRYLVGVRHQVHDEGDPEWLLGPEVQRGFQILSGRGLTYDLLVRTRELPAAERTARMHPDISFVIDHIAKPPIRDGSIAAWERALKPFSTLENVSCKLSGMVTEADWRGWEPDQLVPYVQRVLDWFGEDRVMFGSDWPVCLLAATYDEVVDVLDHALGSLPEGARRKIFGANAARFYGLPVRAEE